jgi:hypothetical protein
MKAYLINPNDRKITEVDYTGDYTNIYTHIGADTFDVARFGESDCVYVDDEGLIKGPVYQFFAIHGHPQPLAGKGLVLGTDAEGESVTPSCTLAWLKANVYWIESLGPKMFGITKGRKTHIVSDIETALAAIMGF